MKTLTRLLAIALVSFATLTACGGGGGGGGGGGIVNPPVPDQSPAGGWDGQAVTQGAPDVFESFEFNATGGFTRGTSPFTATYTDGNAETRNVPGFYISGLRAWHILNGTSATVNFETPPRTLSVWARTAFPADVSSIQIFDVNSVLIPPIITPTNSYGTQPTVVTRTAGETSIGSMVVTSTIGGGGGDVVIDDLTFGYLITTTTDDIDCLVAETLEFICSVTDVTTGALLAGAQGTVQVTGAQVTGSGTLVAAPGTTLADGSSTVANLTITGTVTENSSLNLTITAVGALTSVTTTFNALYDRGSALATVNFTYPVFNIFGDPGSFSVDANGVITVATNSACVGNGQITIINANSNAYDVMLDMTSCGTLNGTYNGLGLTDDDVATDDVFSFAVFTATSVITDDATK